MLFNLQKKKIQIQKEPIIAFRLKLKQHKREIQTLKTYQEEREEEEESLRHSL